jgi:hypothetical protein
MKGARADYELGLMRQRARQAFEAKIQRGHVMWEGPVGFVRTSDDRIEKIADRQVQPAVAGVFQKFRDLGGARQTMLWYRDAQLPLPEVCPGTLGRDIRWCLPKAHRLQQMLRHPSYAGALVYGRTEAKTVIVDGRARQSQRRKKPVAQWRILLLDNHTGYMGWEDFLPTHQLLEANRNRPQDGAGGAAKRGPALLSGWLRVARAVAAAVLEALQPAGIHAALEALEQVVAQQDIQRQALALALEKARYEAQRASRQYALADPANRLVAGE